MLPLSFFLYLSLGLGVLGIFLLIVYKGHEKQLSRLRQEKIKEDMNTIATALSLYHQALSHFPTEEQGLSALVNPQTPAPGSDAHSVDGFLTHIPRDPWNNPYQYIVLKTTDSTFDLVCLGADGRSGGEGEAADMHFKKQVSAEQ